MCWAPSTIQGPPIYRPFEDAETVGKLNAYQQLYPHAPARAAGPSSGGQLRRVTFAWDGT